MNRIFLYRDGQKVNVNESDLKHWLDKGWTKEKPEQSKKKNKKEYANE